MLLGTDSFVNHDEIPKKASLTFSCVQKFPMYGISVISQHRESTDSLIEQLQKQP